ncbi:indolepyruvate ferredoxin oxidoreductase family protein [Niveispirillum sp. SYP-B3756]|uniref:indolepyruvate ferredoxin oxidoreductase family protein n=1 Tax=Niveispirillum sp. SYP-B3756 TaxID=2662178 RepID=UPI00129194AD|nr:indolepyruvate ferredoxin oxidoreductase family protein [Niveispirillum sp. SYP-B3756]MQP68330.1 indolepyruvate ferredoxin oxidoreductase family protein [Niveispirillum sp. SYP-B3756]
MTKTATSLDDKYTRRSGRVFLSSNQALVRLPIDQARRDRAAGLKTAGYISGYRGSPLGVYDAALWAAQKHLDEHDIRFAPGLNEELAATAIRGTQELAWFGKSEYQGVFGLWYGKGLGVDRACEALKLGNLEGASATGGFLAVAGDDHGGKSSASAHQSEHTLIAGFLPVLYPSTTAEIIEFGLYGWVLSRFSGLYVGLKCVTDTLDLTASVELPDIFRSFIQPNILMPVGGLNVRNTKSPLELEALTVNHRLPAAQAFVCANPLDRVVLDAPHRTLGIVAAGKAYLDLRQALADLGLSEERCHTLGIRLYKPGMIWPLEREGAVAFARGHRALLLVEEKRPVMEDQFARYLYDLPADSRPALLGKHDVAGAALLPSVGELSPALIRRALRTVLDQIGMGDGELHRIQDRFLDLEKRSLAFGGGKVRTPFYCSGCPHNTSTKVPDGSYAMSAVGCQGLAAYVMPERRTMLPMPMGGDGMPWVSVGPLVEREHMFQNMGDGTYSHSGLLAIRAAVAAKARMTFKLLYNDAVAMTGGQPVEMHISPVDMVRQLVSEGVSPVALVSDAPEKYAGAALPTGVTVHHRDDLDNVQRMMREQEATSAIVYEQTCATEKRRRRKRGNYPDPDKRVFINQDVCEGCGDCSVQSNCVSILPLETELGRKRKIDQSTCNKDFSCVKGFCPSFVTVEGAKIAMRAVADPARLDALIAKLPAPPVAPLGRDGYNMLVGGIGGTGVLTIGALLGMAAHLEGKGCTVLDMTGMAQKGGAVTAHIRVGQTPQSLYSTRLGVGSSDLILACDAVVGSGQDLLKTINPGITTAIVNLDVTPTGEFQTNRAVDLGEDSLPAAIETALAGGPMHKLRASSLATALIGDSIATNVLMMGYAAQKGLLPVTIASIVQAIELNGTFVKGNLRTFALGRLAAHAPEELAKVISPVSKPAEETLRSLIQTRMTLLTAYQSEAYAQQYLDFVREMETAIAARKVADSGLLLREIVQTLAKLMTYKDEYEVARLHTDPKFWERLREQFDGDFKVKFHLAPPMLPGRDASGRPRKRAFGAWVLPVFRLLARLKGLRGTPFDLFGYTAERRMERQLIADYQVMMRQVVAQLDQGRLHAAIELAGAASDVRGYGPVKHAAYEQYLANRKLLLDAFAKGPPAKAPVDSVTQRA